MFGTARFATESARRTHHSFAEQFSRILKMQAPNSARATETEGCPDCSPPPLGAAEVAHGQPSVTGTGKLGQELGLPQPQPAGKSQYSGSVNATGSESCPPLRAPGGFPLPPAAYSRSYAACFPSLPSSSPSVCQRNYSTGGQGTSQNKVLGEQPQSKRNLNSSSGHSKKLCSESRWSGLDHQATYSANWQHMRDHSSELARGEWKPTSAKRPDMTRFRRSWRPTPLGKGHKRRPESGVEVSVFCYNVLAQCLIESNSHLYEDCPWDLLRWEHRKRNLLGELQAANADIMCLQEVQASHFRDFFSPELDKLGYSALYQKRTGDKHDGCAIFYKKDKFVLEDSKRVRFYRPNISLLDRDNVGLVVLLRPTGQGDDAPKLCVATTHLLYNPKRGDIKLAQLGLLLAEIDHMAAVASSPPRPAPAYHPIILCGDFNSLPHSPLYNFIRHSRLDYVGLQKVMVSGQGSNRRSLDPLNWPLWPYDVGVTDACQFRSVVKARYLNGGNKKQENQEQFSDKSNATDLPPDWEKEFSEIIHHPFSLNSVHCHDDSVAEVTTNHSRTNCTVDYIFFSCSPQANYEGAVTKLPPRSPAGELKLLGYRALMTDQKATDMGGLPNHALSSDHFSLQAKFLLTVPK